MRQRAGDEIIFRTAHSVRMILLARAARDMLVVEILTKAKDLLAEKGKGGCRPVTQGEHLASRQEALCGSITPPVAGDSGEKPAPARGLSVAVKGFLS